MNENSLKLLEMIAQYRSVLVYRWRLIVFVALLLVAVLGAGVQLVPNSYQASTTILAYPRKVPEKYVSATVVDDPSDRLMLLQQEILSSTRLLQVIQEFHLYSNLIASQGREAAVREMRKQLKILTTRGPGNGPSAFTLTFTGNDPHVVAAVANELAGSFIIKNLANREQQVHGTSEFISDQLAHARDDLQAQEAELRAFRMSHLGEMPEQATSNLQAVGQLQVQLQTVSDKLAQVEQEEILIKSAPEVDPALRATNTSNPATALEDDLQHEQARLQELLTHVTPQHPDVIAARNRISELNKQLDKLPAVSGEPPRGRGVEARLNVIEKERSHLIAEQAAIRAKLNSYQEKIDAVPLRQEQLSRYTRDYDTAREHYRSLLEKSYSAQMASELEERQDADRFEVLDRATPPEHPSSPNRRLMWIGCGFFASAVSLLLAFGLEHFDGTIKTEIDLLKILPAEIEFAGLVSNISPVARRGEPQLIQVI